MIHRALATTWSQLLEQAPAIALFGAAAIITLFLANPKPRWLLPLAFGLTVIGVALWVAAVTRSRRENPEGLTIAEVVTRTGDEVAWSGSARLLSGRGASRRGEWGTP